MAKCFGSTCNCSHQRLCRPHRFQCGHDDMHQSTAVGSSLRTPEADSESTFGSHLVYIFSESFFFWKFLNLFWGNLDGETKSKMVKSNTSRTWATHVEVRK